MRFHFLDVLKTVVICILWTMCIFIIGVIISFLFLDLEKPDSTSIVTGIMIIPIFLAVLFSINKHLVRKNGLKWDSLGFITLKKQQLFKLTWQVPLSWLIIILTQAIFMILFFSETINEEGTSSSEIIEISPLNFLILFLALVIVKPILEEIIFRGGIFQTLENIFNTPIALIGSSAIFMLAHSFTPLIMPGIFVMGLILGYLYKKHRSIYAPIILHMFINGVNVITVNFL